MIRGDADKPPGSQLASGGAVPGRERDAAVLGDALVAHFARDCRVSPAAEADLRAVRGELRDISRGHDVLRANGPPSSGVLLLSGMLHGYCARADGAIQIHGFVFPGEAGGLDGILLPTLNCAVSAAVDSRVALVPFAELRPVIDAHQQLVVAMWRETTVQGAMAREWLVRNSLLSARGRMAHLFCEVYVRTGALGLRQGDTCPFPATQELLARTLGITSVHVNRTLQMLRDTGLVELKGGRLQIPDYPALARLAGFDSHYLHLEDTLAA
jgi:CRP-like cAMP-binding protein